MFYAKLTVNEIIVALLTIYVSLISISEFVECSGKRLNPAEEPTTEQVYSIYRMLFANRNYYNLRAAGVLKEKDIPHYYREDNLGSIRRYINSSFEFHSSDFLIKSSILVWFVPLIERSALHVYDDKHDIDLARGPQVNQDLCGLHLDYMNHMVQKHLKGLANSTERSIFYLMNSFAIPHQGVADGEVVFPGIYENCVLEKLNVIRSELDLVDANASERYFASSNHVESSSTSALGQLYQAFLWNVGPFFGFVRDYDSLPISENNQTVRMLPMRYCLAGLRWPRWGNSSLERRNFILRTGVCLPETCDTKSHELYKDKIKQLIDLHMSKFYDGYYIDQLYCLPDERSYLRNPFNYTSTIICIVFNAIWLSTVLLVSSITIYSKFIRTRQISAKKNGSTQKNKLAAFSLRNLLNSFNLFKNFNDFRTVRSIVQKAEDPQMSQIQAGGKQMPKRSRVNLRPMEGLKAYGTMLIIASHETMILLGGVWNLQKVQPLLSETWYATVANIFPQAVNVFFVITGVITSQVLFNKSQGTILRPTFWIGFIIYRYIRIIPIYIFVHWFLKSTFRFLSSGPFWDFGTSSTGWSKICQEDSYWRLMLPSTNYISPGLHCNPVGWYLANDLQLTLITPIIIILLYKKALLGYISVLASVAFGAINHALFFITNEPDPRGLFEWSAMSLTRVTHDTFIGYTSLQFRFVSYFIGLIAGHLLYLYDIGTIKEWSKSFIFYAKMLVYLCLYLTFFSPYFTRILLAYDDQILRIVAAIFGGTIHTLFSFAFAALIILLCTGHWSTLAKHLGKRFFEPFANMSLSTTLVHMPLIYYRGMSSMFQAHLSMYHLLSTILVRIIESKVAAVMFHLIYELPMRNLITKLLFWALSQSKQKNSVLKSD